MHSSIYISSLGLATITVGFIINAVALYLMRKEKSLQTQRDLLTCINASRLLFSVIVFLWWLAWLSYHGRGLEKAIFIIFDGLHLFYIFIVLGMTFDRLVAVTAPLQHKAMPVQHIHRLYILLSTAVSLIMTIVFSLCHKHIKARAYTTLTIDVIFLLITIVANLFVQERWNKRMNLAKKVGAIGRALQRLDTNMTKIGGFLALCAILSTLADIYLVISELHFPANTTTNLSGFIVLFISCLYVLQPLYCVVVGVELSMKDLKQAMFRRKHFSMHTERRKSLFRNAQFRPTWANL